MHWVAHILTVLVRIELPVCKCTCNFFCFASKAVKVGTLGPKNFWGGKKEVSVPGENVAEWILNFTHSHGTMALIFL